MKISYGILIHNEVESLRRLLDSIINAKKDYEWEIVIIYDRPDIESNSDTDKILNECEDVLNVHFRTLNNDFAAQKNYMTEKCSGDWIINPDADELFPDYLLENAHLIIEQNNTECIWVPRINTVDGLTEQWAQKFGFQINEKGYVNWPDYQARIYKRDYPRIHWERPVHEVVKGYKTFTYLPHDLDMAEHVAIKHPKTLERQIQQNQNYAKIMR